ncbi:MAG: hypothetical protein HQL10_04370 [Nitrospirae bacterium]|nr:hypothetical protein [Nitrospirota bacterium]
MRSDRIPRALFGGGRWAYRQACLKIEQLKEKPDYSAERLSDLFEGLDTDIIFAGSGLNTFPAEAIGGDLAFKGEQAPLLSFPIIQKAEDARCLEEVDISHSPHTAALVEMITHLRKRLPDRFLCVTSWGPFTWAMILCEWNLLRDKVVSDKNFVREVCELGVRLSSAFLEPLMERRIIDGIAIPDGAVTLIPNDLYVEIVLPCERKLFEKAKKYGIACFLHQCGDIRHQLDLYTETGADCISLDAGVSIGEVYKMYHETTVTAGNVDVINTVLAGDAALIRKAVADCIAGISDPFQEYILMPSCDIPLDTPLGNVKEFLACADRVY